MTEELATAILEQNYNKDCYAVIQALYAEFDVKDIVQAIARYRATQTVVEIQQNNPQD